MELLLLIAIGFACRSAWGHVRATQKESGAARQKAVEKAFGKKLPRHKAKATGRRHALGWWGREIAGGFPVTRTGWHAGWIGHQTEALHHRAQREEAKTNHAETQASVLAKMPDHKARQAEAQERRDAILATMPPRAKGRKVKEAVREADAALPDEIGERRRAREAAGTVVGKPVTVIGGHVSGGSSVPPLPSDTVTPEPGPYIPAPAAKTSWGFNPDEPPCEECLGLGCDACRGWGNAPWEPGASAADGDAICQACGNRGFPGDPVLVQPGGTLAHRSHAEAAQRDYEDRRMTGDAARNPSDPTTAKGENVASDTAAPNLNDQANWDPIESNASGPEATPSATNGGAPMSDVTFTSVIAAARAGLARSDQDTAEIRTRKDEAYAVADQMAAHGADPSVISAQMDYADALAAAEEKLAQAGEHAGNTATTAERMHGGMQAAHDDAPGKVASREFHGGN